MHVDIPEDLHHRLQHLAQERGKDIDEAGELPLTVQAKLLRALQEKEIRRLGGRESVPIDVRIIATTNRDLEAAVTRAEFREDLYY
jgi:transcriptional regulator with GAF, ATPase, and Fis domain